MARGRGGETQATLALGLVMLALLLNGELELAESKNFTVGDQKSWESTTYIVGDVHGWSFGVNYWPYGKIFYAGDILEFKYDRRIHNVKQVSSNSFDNCYALNPIKTYSSGDDQITLTCGTQYFICGARHHCSVGGMKIKITALEKPDRC